MQLKRGTMFDFQINSLQTSHLPENNSSGNSSARQYHVALNKFRSARSRGKVLRLLKRIFNRRERLYDLNALKPDLHVHGSSYAGIQVVPISSIIGSEGRTGDFDMDFHPMCETARERWVNMALAYLSCVPLPPIQLIQVGEVYFIRDGHHRVSVSRAFGQIAMDAEVITWKASPPFPWQPGAVAENPTLLESAHLST
jgi:hypothetical protein